MALPKFTLTGNLKEILGDLSEAALTRAVIVLESSVGKDVFVTWDGVAYALQDAVGIVDSSGDVLNVEGEPLVLLAQDDGLNIRNLQWRIQVSVPPSAIPPLGGRRLRSWKFYAPADGATIDLADITPVTNGA